MHDTLTRFQVRSPVPAPLWEDLAAQDSHSLPEHSLEWIHALEATNRYRDASRLYEFDDGNQFLLPLVRRRGAGLRGQHLQSYPPGRGWGGLVGPGVEAAHAQAVLGDLQSLGMQRVSIYPSPTRWEVWEEAAHLLGATILPRSAHILDLSDGQDAVFQRFNKTTRRGVRTAARSDLRVEVGNSDRLIADFFELLRLSVDRWAEQRNQPKILSRRLARRRFSFDELRLQRDHLQERFVVICAYAQDDPVYASVSLHGRNTNETHSAMDRGRIGNTRAGDLVQWRAIQLSLERGCKIHHLGESGESMSLVRAKEKYGAQRLDYGQIILERFPWTQIDHRFRKVGKRVLGIRPPG